MTSETSTGYPAPWTQIPNHPAQTPARARMAGAFAIVFGSLGVLFGIIGAGTFLPYADLMGETYRHLALWMTGISIAGIALSLLGVVAGVALRRGRPWARPGTLGVAVALIALVAVMDVLYPVGLFLLVLVLPLWGAVALLAWYSPTGARSRAHSAAL